MKTEEKVRLTQYSHGAGCGCKISPMILDKMINGIKTVHRDQHLLIGNETRDDAAVYAIDDQNAVISTTDFFMPIVDDPFQFGKIASVNAISDVYAMGGKPLMAVSILGWPVDKLAPEIAAEVLNGAHDACKSAGIPLAGGHSIDTPEPIFGLAVTGMVQQKHLKTNQGAEEGCLIGITKPIGIGILTTAEKKGLLRTEDEGKAIHWMTQLNNVGPALGKLEGVKSLTDVTGFGLLGHLGEMCEASQVSAIIDYRKVPVIPEALFYLKQQAIPGGTLRNYQSYGHTIGSMSNDQRNMLCDPQTSGGLLIAATPESRDEVVSICSKQGVNVQFFGEIVQKQDKLIYIS